MYDSAEGNQFIMVITNRGFLFNESCNGVYYHYLEDCDFILFKMVE